jgi:hypothetical protein
MTKDARLYARFTLDFTEHPKIAILSKSAFFTLVDAILYSRRLQTDGFLSKRLALARWLLEDLLELCSNDPDKPSLIECENGWYIHDFCEQQDTKADIEARRQHAKTAGSKGGQASARASARASGQASARASARAKLKQTSSKDREIERDHLTHLSSEVTLVGGSGGKPSPRGTRLPEGWTPDPPVVAQMRSDHPHIDLKAEHAKFLDYWHAKAGAAARKTDWNATWRNWIRRAAEQTHTNGHPTGADAKALAWQALGHAIESKELTQ